VSANLSEENTDSIFRAHTSKDGKVDGYIGEVGERQEWEVRARGEGEERAPKSENGNCMT
jgi:hypothetical protein